MTEENTCRNCGTPVDLGMLFCHEHRGKGLLGTYSQFNNSAGITKIQLKRQAVACGNCGYNLMLRSKYCFICQYDFDTESVSISKILDTVNIDFLKERK